MSANTPPYLASSPGCMRVNVNGWRQGRGGERVMVDAKVGNEEEVGMVSFRADEHAYVHMQAGRMRSMEGLSSGA